MSLGTTFGDFLLVVLCFVVWPFHLLAGKANQWLMKIQLVADFSQRQRTKKLMSKLTKEVKNYQEWYQVAHELDQLRSNPNN